MKQLKEGTEMQGAVIDAKDLRRFEGQKLSTLERRAVTAFNAWIRRRDSEDGYIRCISCDKYIPLEACHASHYMSAGNYKRTRFNEDNVHASCRQCNTHLHGNLIEYRIRLIEKIGEDRVKAVENLARSGPAKIERTDLIYVILKYGKK